MTSGIFQLFTPKDVAKAEAKCPNGILVGVGVLWLYLSAFSLRIFIHKINYVYISF